MASIQKYSVRGKPYWRIVESRRVNGKPRAIPICHLGTAEGLLQRLKGIEASGSAGIKVHSYSHGPLAALKQVAEELGVIELIDRYVTNPKRGVSVGTTLVVAAINRLMEPCSKRAFHDWAKQTSLFKLFPELGSKELTSQFFWDQMHEVSPDTIQKIEAELSRTIVKEYDIPIDTLFYDTTNCYTYIDPECNETKLLRYGHSKEKQQDRLLFGVGLLVSRKAYIPLQHFVYPGNTNDCALFPDTLKNLIQRLKFLDIPPNDVTLVFDRGNNSKTNFELVYKEKVGLVAAARIGDVPLDNFSIPLRRFTIPKAEELSHLRVFRSKTIYGKREYTSVLYINEKIKRKQIIGLDDQLKWRLDELHEWQQKLLNHTSRLDSTDAQAAKRKIARLLAGGYISEILSIQYDAKKEANKALSFSVDERAKANLIQNTFGRRLLLTNRHDWSTEEIVNVYFNQSTVEQAFRTLKDDRTICIRPQFHWTDHSITVHVFICYIALLLSRLLLLKAQKVQPISSFAQLMNILDEVRLVAILSAVSTDKHVCSWTLEQVGKDTSTLFTNLCPGQMPNTKP